MLTRQEMSELRKTLEGEMVLSVYVAREGADPGKGQVWSSRLSSALRDARAEIETTEPGDLPAFDAAKDRITEALSQYGRVLPSSGWAAFATADRLWHGDALPFEPTPSVRWQRGVFAAPYVRSWKAVHPVVAAVVDTWRARIVTVEDGGVSDELMLETEQALEEMSDTGVSKRASSATGATGVRGATGTDAAKRSLEEDTKRLAKRVAAALLERAGDGSTVVVGGTKRAISAVAGDVQDRLVGRFAELPELSFDTSMDELVERVETAASAVTVERQTRFLEAVIESSRGGLGWNDTSRALAAGAVDTLLLARGLIESSPSDADQLVHQALTQGAAIEELGGELGDRLVAEWDGVVSRLRFQPS